MCRQGKGQSYKKLKETKFGGALTQCSAKKQQHSEIFTYLYIAQEN
jgi:hypothetical protein